MDQLPLLLSALIVVESNGNDRAIGDRGAALGALQIHECVVRDVNRIAGTRLSHRDVHSRPVALWVATVYLNYYASGDRLGRPPTAEDRARIWVGGPDGYKQRSTLQYWRKVRKVLNSLERGAVPTSGYLATQLASREFTLAFHSVPRRESLTTKPALPGAIPVLHRSALQ